MNAKAVTIEEMVEAGQSYASVFRRDRGMMTRKALNTYAIDLICEREKRMTNARDQALIEAFVESANKAARIGGTP